MTSALVGEVVRRPGHALRVALALARGHWLKWWLPLRGVRFESGKNLRIFGRLRVRGPGRVIFGDNVRVDMSVTPWTHNPEAVIRVGDGTFLNGTSFGCARLIEIGARSILADARIMDTDFHSIHRERHDNAAPVRVAPVRLEANVWVSAQAGILPGTTIGRNSVVGFGAVCAGEYPADSIIAGNPARPIRKIPDASAPAVRQPAAEAPSSE
jgi:acetyltransferase-like isoleucine patch superfamily enzyme